MNVRLLGLPEITVKKFGDTILVLIRQKYVVRGRKPAGRWRIRIGKFDSDLALIYNVNMAKDFLELTQYLSQRFDKVDTDIDYLKGKIDEMDSDITDFKENKADKTDIDNLLNAVDAYAKKADTFFQEMVMLSHKVDRHEKWFHLIAEKLGIKLEY